jgi:hypothetical protein
VLYGRFVRRLVTLVWGLAFVGEALLDTFLLYHLPTAQWVAIHPLLFWGTMVAAFGWATLYAQVYDPEDPSEPAADGSRAGCQDR